MLTAKQCDVISGLAFNRMNISAVAKMMHFHRNNICYHIAQIKKKTGLDPLDFFDLHELYRIAGGEEDGS